jgi:hypothetical protein
MRLTTAGEVRRIDLRRAIDLVPVAVAVWSEVEFDADGRAIDPRTGLGDPALVLVEGRHRQVGARYEVTVEAPRTELPADVKASFDEERVEAVKLKFSDPRWEDFRAREQAAKVWVGIDRTTVSVRLRHDDGRRLSVTVDDETGTWTVDVDLHLGRQPKVEATLNVDLTATMRAAGSGGCPSRVMGGPLVATATVDLSALDVPGGELAVADGSANRFRAAGRAEVRTGQDTWSVTARGSVGARGLGRPVLWIFGWYARWLVNKGLTEAWATADARIDELDRLLADLAARTEADGPEHVLRQALWSTVHTMHAAAADPSTHLGPPTA